MSTKIKHFLNATNVGVNILVGQENVTNVANGTLYTKKKYSKPQQSQHLLLALLTKLAPKILQKNSLPLKKIHRKHFEPPQEFLSLTEY